MTTSRDRLLPTPVVDKNGKLTTVYRSPMSEVKSQSIPPPVALKLEAQDEAEKATFCSNFSLSGPPSRIGHIYETIHAHDPTVITYLNQLVSTGTPATGSVVTNLVGIEMLDMGSQIESHTDYGKEDITAYKSILFGEYKCLAVAAWHVSEMSQTLKMRAAMNVNSFARVAYYLHGDTHPEPHSEVALNDIAYWRGLSILVFSDKAAGNDESPIEFATWAGTQPDPYKVYQTMMDHDTMDIAHLTDLLAQEATTAPSLVQGIL